MIPGSLIYKETKWSQRARADEDWMPDYITFTFTARVKCNNASCQDEVAVAGKGGLDHYYDQEGDSNYAGDFQPHWCFPMPDIFELPKKCPADVAAEIRGAFSLFWADRSAAANRIRVALERLMDHLAIQTRRKNKKGRFDRLSLHQRIEVFGKVEPTIGGELLALKWLGNTGSHDGKVGRDDLLDAFEIVEHALMEVVEQRSKRLRLLAQGLTDKHRPGSRRKSKVSF